MVEGGADGQHKGQPGHVREGGHAKIARLGESVQDHCLGPALPTLRMPLGLLLSRDEAGHTVTAGVSTVWTSS